MLMTKTGVLRSAELSPHWKRKRNHMENFGPNSDFELPKSRVWLTVLTNAQNTRQWHRCFWFCHKSAGWTRARFCIWIEW